MTRIAELTAIALLMTLTADISTAQDLENGRRQYAKCRTCHDVGDSAKHKVGPLLNDIIGRKAGSFAEYAYSDNLKELAAKGLVWSDDNLHKYMEDPKSVVPTGKMVFPGLKDKADRDDVIAYLRQFAKK